MRVSNLVVALGKNGNWGKKLLLRERIKEDKHTHVMLITKSINFQ